MMLVLGMSACAHQSKITPSNGHIDGQNTTKHQAEVQSGSNNTVDGKPVTANIPKPVTNNTYLPPPKPKAKAQLYSIVVYDTPVKEVLFAIARDSKLNIDIHPSIQGRVTLNAVDQTLPAILERLSKQVDLTYKLQNDVLTITPDQPVLRSYKIDYVNMSRDTTGFIGADGQISSTSQISGASGTASSSAGNGANNSSRTSVTSESKSHFWETLEKNLKDILAETDKEVLITRSGNTSKSNEKAKAGVSSKTSDTDTANSAEAKREKEEDRNEYKTLFAGTVIVNREAGIINVRATNKQHEKIQEFIDKVMGSAKKQVLIEATIVEVTLNDGYKAGIDWSRLGSLGSAGFVFKQALGPQLGAVNSAANVTLSSSGIIAGYTNGNRGILSSVQLLEQFGNTKVLSSPKLMVLNNQTAVLKVVDNLVYFTVQSQISQSASGVAGTNLQSVTTTPNTVPVGVVMSVTPQINDTGNVNINVRPTITSLIRYVPDPNPQIQKSPDFQGIPEIRTREMESLLQISSGNIAVLGGLMQDEIKNSTEAVPGLSKVPGVGKVFQGKNDSNQKTELVIFLRPTVIPNASLESDELAHYKQYLPTQALERASEAEAENER
ncbi:pilus (MSHA type) biogenesis protein MshL [Methylotenera versatilis]|uniref:Pilus (MSHA type) biogenesis protein MshL n=1 Tax=Methylotenera versatilis (strain 301) TaxID=666681 RepID=D7DKS0_METV0|nr:pilus (MSHA type) biogenesis protein MshL [Methylotenera versatilis]ADI28531.1 pilus (MSHA type) biogenesis protein MshL [Methylotenera versatilis 301]